MAALRSRRSIGAAAGALGGVLAAAMPAVALAQEGLRELDTPADTARVILFFALGLAALFAAGSVLFLYRRQRHLRWDYQLREGTLSEGELADAGGGEHH